MKMLKNLAFGCLIGALSATAFANNKAAEAALTNATETTQAVQSVKTLSANVVNINTASAAELQDKLVGVGAKKAQAIVEYREKYGNFTSVDQLSEVSGIGSGILKQNRELIVLE